MIEMNDLPTLPASWAWDRASNVCLKIQDGTHFSPKNQHPSGQYRYVTAKNIRPWGMDLSDITYLDERDHRTIYERCDPKKGDVLLVKDGVNTGDAALNTLDEEFSLLSSVCMLRPDARVLEGAFLRYFLQSPIGYNSLTGQMSGTAIKRIVLHRIRGLPVPVAPLPEQRRIVAEIETQFTRLDAAVAALERARANLKRYRAAVLEGIFTGPLVPVSSVLRSPLANGRSVPDGPGGFPVLRLTALQNGWLDLEQFKEGAWSEEQAQPFLVGEEDFFVARGNGSLAFVGRGGLAPASKTPVAFPDTMIRIRCDPEKVLPQYLRLVWNAPSMRRQIELAARTTAGIYKINQRDIERFSIPTPSIEEQRKLAEDAGALLTIADRMQMALDANLTRTERMRQSILRKAFAGKLVPQDPDDEPASALLERFLADCGAASVAS